MTCAVPTYCLYVCFQADHLALNNQLVCSSLGKATSPALSFTQLFIVLCVYLLLHTTFVLTTISLRVPSFLLLSLTFLLLKPFYFILSIFHYPSRPGFRLYCKVRTQNKCLKLGCIYKEEYMALIFLCPM